MLIKVAKFLSIVAVLLSAVEGAKYLAEKRNENLIQHIQIMLS